MIRGHNKLAVHLRVLRALMLREMITRYGRASLGYAWAVLEPTAFIALLSLLFAQVAHSPPVGRSFVLFYATGYVGFHWFHDISSVTARSVFVNRPLLAFPPVTPLDTVIARFLLQALTAIATGAVIFGTILAVFADPIALDIRALMTAFALAAALGLGTGMANCWLFAQSRSWELVWGVISRPLFLISGVFFTFASLPGFARDALWYNPLIHVTGFMRAGFYPVYDASYADMGYVLGVAAALGVLGMAAIWRAPARLVTP
ncbi:MAG: ABC transporter permease [Pseudomonadota bacterium]